MSNGEVCCILGVCCPAGSTAQRVVLMQMVQKNRPHMTEEHAYAAADRILKKHDNFASIAGLIDNK